VEITSHFRDSEIRHYAQQNLTCIRHEALVAVLENEVQELIARMDNANKRSIAKDDEMAPLKSKLHDAMDTCRQLSRELNDT
jgi:shikimate kinase